MSQLINSLGGPVDGKCYKSIRNPLLISSDEYRLAASESDSFLRMAQNNKAVVAINDLHFTKRSAYSNSDSIGVLHKRGQKHNIFYTIKFFVFFIYIFFKSFFFKRRGVVLSSEAKVDFLFVSHYTGHKKSQEYADSYFGEIIDQLQQSGKRCIVAYINHEKNHNTSIPCKKGLLSVLLTNESNFQKLIEIYNDLLISFFLIRKSRCGRDIPYSVRISMFSPGAVRNLIIANQIEDIVSQVSPKCIVATYEGHAWERLAFSSSRKANSKVRCVSYQHAPIFKYHHAIRRNIGGKYDPDILLTSGLISKRQFELSPELKVSNISVLGSNRYIAQKNMRTPDEGSYLVVPEGAIEECDILFGFALDCAKGNSDISFIFRFPPMVDMSILIKHNKNFLNIPDNITISKVDLLDDILKSSSILYRGSSVVIQGVVFGLRPIYLRVANELTIDPLYEVKDGREIICNIAGFEGLLLKKIDKSASKYLVDYCKKMYTPLDVSVLESVLN